MGVTAADSAKTASAHHKLGLTGRASKLRVAVASIAPEIQDRLWNSQRSPVQSEVAIERRRREFQC
jgi:hypothetical protein